jgi:hypothetical protein
MYNKIVEIKNAKTGDLVEFGAYAQSAASGAWKRPIVWRVLKSGGEELFLLSEKILDFARFNDKCGGDIVEYSDGCDFWRCEPVFWNESSIRKFLNDEFLNNAFSADEKSKIIKSEGNCVFLLSSEQAEQIDKNNLTAKTTDYAVAKSNNTGWWLSSKGSMGAGWSGCACASYVTSIGTINDEPCVSKTKRPFQYSCYGIRPAIKLKKETTKMSEKEKTKYDIISELIDGGYKSICDNHGVIYDYIKSIRATEPKKAAGLELSILYQVPRDNSINQEIERLRKILEESPK